MKTKRQEQTERAIEVLKIAGYYAEAEFLNSALAKSTTMELPCIHKRDDSDNLKYNAIDSAIRGIGYAHYLATDNGYKYRIR